jgi:uncharacterized protein YfaS (alpha-2-macroglobulin family)
MDNSDKDEKQGAKKQSAAKKVPIKFNKAKFIRTLKVAGIIFGVIFLLCGSPWLRSGLNTIALFWTPDISGIDGSFICTTRETPQFRLRASGAGKYRFSIYAKEALKNASQTQNRDAFEISPIPAISNEKAVGVLLQSKPLYSFEGWLHALDFNWADAPITLPKPLPAGDYLILAETTNPFFPAKHDHTARCFRVSDLGLIVKQANDKAVIQAVDLVTLTPRAGVEIHMSDLDKPLSSNQARTGTDGIAVIKRQSADQKRNICYYAQSGRDCATSLTVPNYTDWIQFGNYDNEITTSMGYSNSEAEQYHLHFATDRSAYRLGQTVRFKGTTRFYKPGGLSNIGSNVPVKIEVDDPAQEKVWSGTLLTNKFGAVNGSLHLPQAGKTGFYTVFFYYPGGAELRDSFEVIEYRKPEFEVKVAPVLPVTIAGDTLKVKIQANYYFGAPVANAKVKYTVSSSDTERSFEETQESQGEERRFFESANTAENNSSSSFNIQGQAVTDQSGEAIIEINTQPASQQPKGSLNTRGSDQMYVVNADVTDIGLKTVSSKGSALVVPGDFSLQVKTNSHTCNDNEPIEVTVIARTNDGASVANRKLSVGFYNQNYDMFGKYEQQEDTASVQTLSTDAMGKATVKLTASSNFASTNIFAESLDDKGRKIFGETAIFIERQSSGEESAMPGSLTMDKEYYRPGDTARVLITTPIKDIAGTSAFISVDGATIYDYKSLKMTSTPQYIEVPIRSAYAPNVYVTLTFLDRRHKPYSLSKEIKVYPSDGLFKVSVESNKPNYQPGAPASFTVKATRLDGTPAAGAEVNFAVVDESIFAINPDQKPGIQQAIYARVANAVQTFATFQGFNPLSSLSPELWRWDQSCYAIPVAIVMSPFIVISGLNAPPAILWALRGGSAFAITAIVVYVVNPLRTILTALGPLMSSGTGSVGPPVRTDFRDTVFWSPSLITDADGIVRASVKMPDNLTTWRATAYAIDMNRGVGSGMEKVVTSKSLIARLSLPRFYCQGDSAFITGIVHNYSGKAQPVRVTLTCSPHFKATDKLVREVTVADGQAQEIVWPVSVSGSGTATIKLEALGQESDALEVKIPILSFGFTDFRTSNGVIKEARGTRTIPIEPDPNADAQSAQYELALSASQIGPVLGNFSSLINYPYGCTEQTMSRLIPSVVAMRLQKDLGVALPKGAREKFEDVRAASMTKLADLQRSDGGWGWWTTDEQSDPYLTAYVLEGLFQLRQVGYQVDQKFIDRGLVKLKDYAGHLILRPWNRELATDHARTLYVLSLYGEKPSLAAVAWHLGQSLFAPPEALSYLAIAFHRTGNEKAALIAYSQLLSLANKTDEFLDWDHTSQMIERLKLRGASTYTYRFTGTETTALALQAVLAMEPDNEDRRARIRSWILLQRGKDGWDNTKTTAQVFVSLLADDLVTHKKSATNFKVRAADVSTGKLIEELVFNQKNMYEAETKCNYAGSAVPSKIVLSKQGGGTLFYNSTLTYQRKLKPGESLEAKSMPKELGLMRDFFGLATVKDGSVKDGSAKDGSTPDLLRLKRIPLAKHIKAGETLLMRVRVKSPVAVPYVMIEVPLPSGAEVVSKDASDLQLVTGDENSKEVQPSRWWWSHQDVLDDRIVFFVTNFPEGTCEFTTLLRMEMPGRYNINPAQMQGMYTNKVRAYSTPDQLNVER